MTCSLLPHRRIRASAHVFFMDTLASSLTMAALVLIPGLVLAEDGSVSSGTGIAVSRQGHILTNYHVVENCAAIRVVSEGQPNELTIIATDSKNDLAILKLPQPLPFVAIFREGRSIRSGDSIVVVGFPLHSLLASEANVTTGTVSALAGLENDTRLFQITAPVQPGNSGGPLLDKSGHVVGVVVSKLNALAMALLTGDIPQNINFAIKDVVAKAFMDSHRISYEKAASTKDLEAADIGDAAKQFTFLLKCYPRSPKAKHRASIDVERQSLEAERRALEKERQAFADERRRSQEGRAGALEGGGKQRGIVRSGPPKEEADGAGTRDKFQANLVGKEVQAEVTGANEHATRLQHEQRAREAMNEARRQALSANPETVEEARRRIEEARALTPPMEVAKLSDPRPIPYTERTVLPVSAFNHAYNDYLSGKYALAVTGFRRFMEQFPGTLLIPNATYWLAESYYNLKDYGTAAQTLDYLIAKYPESEKIPASLYRLGLVLAETQDHERSRITLKRLMDQFPHSDEAALAKTKLRETP